MAKSWRDALKKPTAVGSNPFELRFNKNKFETLTAAKNKLIGKPGQSKKKAEQNREQTLLKEFRSRSKTSKFVDRRFGVKNGEDTSDDVALKRFSLARKRANYNLSDKESDSDQELTHKGTSLSAQNMTDFIDSEDSGSEQDFDQFGAGSNAVASDIPKSKAEAMKEVISKSKFHKYERQKQKEENELLRGDLDANFDLIKKGLLFDGNKRRKYEQESEQEDDYDTAVKQLIFEKRLTAQEEQKTLEEMEKIQFEKTFKKAADLEKRMHGDVSVDGADETDLELSRKMLVIEMELGKKVDLFCRSKSSQEANDKYKELTNNLKTLHQQVLLGRVIRSRVQRIFSKFTEKVFTGKAYLNGTSPLLLLKLIGSVYPTSDFHHIIVTPGHLCGLYLLDYCKQTKSKHLVLCLWLCEILLDYQTLSKRYIPEVMNCLYFLHVNTRSNTSECLHYSAEKKDIKFNGSADFTTDNVLTIPEMISKLSFMAKLEEVIMKSAKLYADLDAFPEIFEPFTQILELKEMVKQAIHARCPLLLHDHKPIPLPQLEPEIDDDCLPNSLKRRRTSENSQKEIQRLKAAHKKERRGAERELRKDALFLTRQQLSEQKAKDANYKTRTDQLYGSIGNEGSKREKSLERTQH